MTFTRQKFALFYSVRLTDEDLRDLSLSGVRRVQIVSDLCTEATLSSLKDAGVRVVTVRLQNEDMEDEAGRALWTERLVDKPLIDTAILGNEPDAPYNLRYGFAWGNEPGGEAWQVAYHVQQMAAALKPYRIVTVSPAFTALYHYRDWRQGLQPGHFTWLEICRNAFDACDLNAFHWYGGDTSDFDLLERDRVDLWLGQSMHHKPLYIDELGIDPHRYRPAELMRAYLHLATMLLRPPTDLSVPYGGAGVRVEALTPFISNGVSDGSWDSRYLLSDPECYDLVNQFMGGTNF